MVLGEFARPFMWLSAAALSLALVFTGTVVLMACLRLALSRSSGLRSYGEVNSDRRSAR